MLANLCFSTFLIIVLQFVVGGLWFSLANFKLCISVFVFLYYILLSSCYQFLLLHPVLFSLFLLTLICIYTFWFWVPIPLSMASDRGIPPWGLVPVVRGKNFKTCTTAVWVIIEKRGFLLRFFGLTSVLFFSINLVIFFKFL